MCTIGSMAEKDRKHQSETAKDQEDRSAAAKDKEYWSAAIVKDREDGSATTKDQEDQSTAAKDREYRSATTKDWKIEVLLQKDQVIVCCRRWIHSRVIVLVTDDYWKLPMTYRCISLILLKILSLSLLL